VEEWYAHIDTSSRRSTSYRPLPLAEAKKEKDQWIIPVTLDLFTSVREKFLYVRLGRNFKTRWTAYLRVQSHRVPTQRRIQIGRQPTHRCGDGQQSETYPGRHSKSFQESGRNPSGGDPGADYSNDKSEYSAKQTHEYNHVTGGTFATGNTEPVCTEQAKKSRAESSDDCG
jgi:hypothetical protein